MGHRKRLLSLIAGVALVGALPSIAVANTTEAIAQTGGMTLTLPGAPLSLGITLDEFGNIDTVSVDPAFTSVHANDHKVTFESADDGSTVVKVKAVGQKLTAKIKTSNLSELAGDQTWSSVVFELPGGPSVVTFTIEERTSADGKTYLAITDLGADGTPHDKSVIAPTTTSESHDDDDDDDEWEYESKAGVDYFQDGYTKSLRIVVETEYEDDDDHEGVQAKLKIELRGKDVQQLEGVADVVGPQNWTGLLCDGTTASVQYEVDGDGNVSVGLISADGYTWDVDTEDDGFKVEFDNATNDEDDGAYVKVEVENEDGQLKLKVSSRTTASCDDDDDRDDDDGEGHRDDDDEDDDDEDHDGDKVKDDDDEDHSGSDSRNDDDDDDDEDDD